MSKQGVDDFIVTHGPEAFLKLVEATKNNPRSILFASQRFMSQKRIANAKQPVKEILKRKLQAGRKYVDIGSGESTDIETCTMEDAAKCSGAVEWLIPRWLPYGLVTAVIAEPGIGKSAFVLGGIVRPVVTGGCFYTGHPATQSKVLWCSTENDTAITVKRMDDWEIPKSELLLPFADDPLRSVDLNNESHLSRIEQIINHFKTRLMVLDSLRGAHGDDENNSRVGRVVSNLSAIAQRTHASIVIIHHSRKLALDEEISANSSRGSNAINAALRSVILIDRPDRNSQRCRLQVNKEHFGEKPKPIGFEITTDGLLFGDAPSKPRKIGLQDEAAEFLKSRMEPGIAYKASDMIEEAIANGHTERTTQKAAQTLGIVPTRSRENGKIGGWEWKLPTAK